MKNMLLALVGSCCLCATSVSAVATSVDTVVSFKHARVFCEGELGLPRAPLSRLVPEDQSHVLSCMDTYTRQIDLAAVARTELSALQREQEFVRQLRQQVQTLMQQLRHAEVQLHSAEAPKTNF